MKFKHADKVLKPWPVNLHHTDVGQRIRDEQKRLLAIKKKPVNVTQLKRRGAK